MSGTHRHDGSSRASTTIRHPQDASDTHCLYRHPQDASNHADSKAVGKQQAFATLHGVLAKNPAILNGATDIESHHYDADAYANPYGDDSHNHPHNTNPSVVSNTGCYAIALQQDNTSKSVMNQDRWDRKEKFDGTPNHLIIFKAFVRDDFENGAHSDLKTQIWNGVRVF
jgi:hypothetical protein